MIIKFKIYENLKKFRYVNLCNLSNDIESKYKRKLLDMGYSVDSMMYIRDVLIDKEVEFCENMFGDIVFGRIREVNFNTKIDKNDLTFNDFLSIYFYGDKNTYTYSLEEPDRIKVYNSEITDIEESIILIKNMERYNI